MIDKFKQAFQEEAREILVELESALLELNDNRGDSELVGRAFRALHTIKGSGSMFGFDDISRFTHHIENAFDQVRSGRLKTTEDLISLTLAGVDQIKAMLDEAVGQGKADPSVCTQILGKLRGLTGAPETPGVRDQTKADAAPPRPPEGELRPWRIHFAPGADLMRCGADPLLLLRELRQLGSLEIKASMAAVPVLVEFDPERCYVAWDMVLVTAVAVEAIHDVFIFVEDNCELRIEPGEADPERPSADRRSSEGESKRGTTRPQRRSLRIASTAPVARPGRGRPVADKSVQATSIRVAAAKLDQLVDLVGQLVTVQARLGDIAARSGDHEMLAVVEEVEALTSELRENSMSMRTLPLRSTFERLRRLVYDLGRTLHKEVELTFEGGDTDLDKQ